MKVLITGITGQDGSYMADLALSKGCAVYGVERVTSEKKHSNIKHIKDKIHLVEGDLSDYGSIYSIISSIKPDIVFNFAAQSFVGVSWRIPEQTGDITGLGVGRILEAIRQSGIACKFYQASSSEMYGNTVFNKNYEKLNEETPFDPHNPYGIAKLYGHLTTKNYRDSYGMFAVSGILFNHESERRGVNFVTRKITDGIARIVTGKQDHITLGNIEVTRDWGYAPDYMQAVWDIMSLENPEDFVIGTGVNRSLREFIKQAFSAVGFSNPDDYIRIDKDLFRPVETPEMKCDFSKAEEKIGWKGCITPFGEWVKKMVDNDIEIHKNS